MPTTTFASSGRGCGFRDIGACYLAFGIGPGGRPIEEFIIDPVLPWPSSFQRGFKIIPASSGINHVAIFVGEAYYASLWTFIEEARRFGISRKVPPTFPFHQLTPGRSMMFFIHPKACPKPGTTPYSLDRDPHHPLKGCKFYKEDQEVWEKNPIEFAGWHPSVRTKKEEGRQVTACTFAHRDLACLLHSEDEVEHLSGGQDGYPFKIKAPSFEYTGNCPVLPNVLKGDKLENYGPGVFLKVPLTHVECRQKAGQWEQNAKKAGYNVEVLEY